MRIYISVQNRQNKGFVDELHNYEAHTARYACTNSTSCVTLQYMLRFGIPIARSATRRGKMPMVQRCNTGVGVVDVNSFLEDHQLSGQQSPFYCCDSAR